MTKEFDAGRLDVAAFAQAGGTLDARESLRTFERLHAEAATEAGSEPEVHWQAHGAMRALSEGAAAPWLHVQAQAAVPATCQRCLQPMTAKVEVDRWFRFVADEPTAAAEDEDAEEDVLALSRAFDLRELIEDELLMEMPAAPRHDECPQAVPMSAQDPDFDAVEAARPSPFAALAQLRKKPSDEA